ncbi:hypothetical protein GCM10009617_38050 [Leifsonia poae]|uniref:Uncharacterized protein n=1 Tax=Leifsonia poae TaxID=110933 RepID=A0A9W6M0J0_9MICO|nr:hypothetical protein GCM10017584_22830 [Leifsonia poae]
MQKGVADGDERLDIEMRAQLAPPSRRSARRNAGDRADIPEVDPHGVPANPRYTWRSPRSRYGDVEGGVVTFEFCGQGDAVEARGRGAAHEAAGRKALHVGVAAADEVELPSADDPSERPSQVGCTEPTGRDAALARLCDRERAGE